MSSVSDLTMTDNFSLVQGGPLFQLFVRSRLSTPALGWLGRRIISMILLTWLPLLVLSAFSKQAMVGVQMPFVYDIATHVRFLLGLPLLMVAELVAHKRLRPVVAQFLEREIIRADIRPRFDDCIASALKWRNSLVIEMALLLLALTMGPPIFLDLTGLNGNATVWYAQGMSSSWQWSPAGYWMAHISLPVYQFILLRWLFRIMIWSRFLWQVSRLDLRLIPTHPDHAAGLGFLSGSVAAFIPLLLSQSAVLSAVLADRILYSGAALIAFKVEVVTFVVLFLLLVLGPLSVFSPALYRSKRQGLLSYGTLASRYVSEFDNKWLHGGAGPKEALIGSGDIQSLADLNNSFEVIRNMQVFPFGRQAVTQVTVAILLPLLPLLLTMISLEDLLKRLIGILL